MSVDWTMSAPASRANVKPGDQVARLRVGGRETERFTVLDPPWSPRGKLRMRRESTGTELRAWWSRGWLPRRHEWVDGEGLPG